MRFGKEVRRLRELAGISQAELSEKMGVHQTFLSKVELGAHVPGADVLFKLCDPLGVSCDHFRPFLADAPEPPKKGRKGKTKK